MRNERGTQGACTLVPTVISIWREIELADGRRGHFLGCNGLRANFALLNTQNLEWEWLKD